MKRVICLMVSWLALLGVAEGLDLVEMPVSKAGDYVLSSSVGKPRAGRHWGRPEMVRHLILVAKEWKKRYPERPRLRIGDIAKYGGGPFPPHKTHQDGLAVDITTSGKNVCHIKYGDQEHSRELAELFVSFGAKQILYNHKHVIDRVSVVRKWPKHDDHFHVVIDPSKVPKDGEPVLVAGQDSVEGTLVGRTRLEGGALELSWRLLGGSFKVVSMRVQFDDLEDGAVLHDSGWLAGGKSYRVPAKLVHGVGYRWKVDLRFDKGEELGLDWMGLEVDLEAPKVRVKTPSQGEVVEQPVRYSWDFEDKGRLARYRIELSKSKDGRRAKVVGEGQGLTEHVSRVLLAYKRTYYWRLVVMDEAGNRNETAWFVFKTGKKPKREKRRFRKGEVTASSLNLRVGAGVSHRKLVALPKGTVLKIVGEKSGWLEVEAALKGKIWKGFVSKSYVKMDEKR